MARLKSRPCRGCGRPGCATASEVAACYVPGGVASTSGLWGALSRDGTVSSGAAEMQRRAERGTAIHGAIEAAIRAGGMTDEIAGVEPATLWGFHMWAECAGVYRPDATLEERVEGELDGLPVCGSPDWHDGSTVMDWKTSKSVQPSHRLQVAIYAHLTGCSRAKIVRVGPDGIKETDVKNVKTLIGFACTLRRMMATV